jgi:hypothetical protein
MRVNIKKQLLKKILFVFFILTLGSCKDSSIFYTISQEEAQLEPLIKGSPTNFVEFNGNVYVGSGTTLYRYNNKTMSGNPARGDWSTFTPGGNIIQLAATDTAMYALCGDYGKFILRKSNNGSSWSNVQIPEGISIQAIYAAGNQLFIGASTSGVYYILDDTFKELAITGNKLLNGAASDGTNSYLITKDMGTTSGSAYVLTGGTLNSINSSAPFMGIINLGSTIAAISRDGVLYNVTSGAVSSTSYKLNGSSKGNFATGALAIWRQDINDPSSQTLLLAGRQEKPANEVNYLHGYQELDLANGIISGAGFHDPGTGTLSTVDNNAAYKSNMEKNPINYIFQANDGIIFASTQTKGVWSYRLRDGKWQWNAEQ